MFRHCNVSREVRLVHTPKRPQKVPHSRPQALRGIDVDFANAIAILIARPFMRAMIYRDMRSCHLIVPLPFICVRHSVQLGELPHMLRQRFPIGTLDHPQSDLPTLAADRADDRRTVLGIGAMPFLFVGTLPWGI